MTRTALLFAILAVPGLAQVPGATPLSWEGEFAPKILDGMHRYIDRRIDELKDAMRTG